MREVANDLIGVILKAGQADENELKSTRTALLEIINKVGARNFVNMVADTLKNNFKIEGCNDVRIPLKRIFTVPLEELEADLSKQRYDLPGDHPVFLLSQDHKENIRRLKVLRFSLGSLNLNRQTPPEKIKDKLNQTKDYTLELNLHIRKEEEVLFPVLEQTGMQEHPQNLKEEHKNFQEGLSRIIEILEKLAAKGHNLAVEEVTQLKEKFASDISNHIFRETHIFYPAALEFICEPGQWEKIKQAFIAIK